MSALHICLVCPYSFDEPGGVQNQVLGLSQALARAGFRVSVIGPGTTRPPLADPGSVEVELVGPSLSIAVNGSRAPIAPFPAAMRKTARALDRLAPDVVHVHEPFVPGPSLAALYHRGRAAQGQDGHDRAVLGTFHRAGASALYRLSAPFARRMLTHVAVLTAVSSEAGATLRAVTGTTRPVEVLFNGVALERFAAGADAERDEDEIVFVGRLEERKGLAVLLQAFALLRARFRLVVVGDGPDRAAMAKLYAGEARISFLGRLNDEAVAEVLANAALVAVPSLFGESFGVVLLEAMAAGALVVASDLPGYRVAGGSDALYVPPGDAFALARAIESLLEQGAPVQALRAAGRRRAESFSFEALVGAYTPLYEHLASST